MTLKTFAETKAGYTNLWVQAKVPAAHHAALVAIAQKIKSGPYWSAFKEVEAETKVPAELIGALLYRESSLNLGTYLGNGQSLNHVTTVEPIGRGPWSTFKAGAVDALTHEGMTGITAWTVPLMLYWAERFNGQGYFSHGNSPYVWSWTDQYHGGLFVADHDYSATTVDPRPGVAAILKVFYELNPELSKETSMAPTTAAPVTVPAIQMVDPIPQIIAFLELAKKYLPMVVGFIPAPFGGVATAAIPIVEEVLQLIEDAKNKTGVDLFKAIGAHIETIGQHVQTTASTAAQAASTVAAAAGAPTQGMPNAG